MAKVYIEKHYNDVVYVTNSLTRDLDQSEFVVIGKLSGVVDRNTKDGAEFGLQIEPFMEIQVEEGDLNPGTFAEGDDIYFNPTSGLFADAAAAGFSVVGQIAHNRITENGYVTFFKYPLAG